MNDASLIRTIMARECETVNEYEELAAKAESEAVRNLILHFAKEEKEHIAECSQLLEKIDADYEAFLKKPLSHVYESLASGDETAPSPNAAAAQAAPSQAPSPAAVSPTAATATESADTAAFMTGVTIATNPYERTVGSLFRADRKR
ncbi:MAG: hypothetical protein KC502_02555 [Myxococcales bacterium]|nr:hypothetical protein [Myxococcales bacterium]